jgi:hypothetical protein
MSDYNANALGDALRRVVGGPSRWLRESATTLASPADDAQRAIAPQPRSFYALTDPLIVCDCNHRDASAISDPGEPREASESWRR